MSQDAYTCQRCRQPLLLDPSLTNVTQAQYDQLSAAVATSQGQTTLTSQQKLARIPTSSTSRQAYLQATSNKLGQSSRHPANPSESFVLLGESVLGGGVPFPQSPFNGGGRTAGGVRRGQLGPTGGGGGLIGKPQNESQTQGQDPSSSNPTTNLNGNSSNNNNNNSEEPPQSISKLSLTDSLLQSLSTKTSIDHPLCQDCSSLLQEILQGKLEELQRERDGYIAFEREWAHKAQQSTINNSNTNANGSSTPSSKGKSKSTSSSLEDQEWEENLKKKLELQEEEIKLLKELKDVEREEEEIRRQEKELEVEEAEMERDELEFLRTHERMNSQIHSLSTRLQTEQTLHLLASQALSRLESTNVYNDVFQIGHVPLIASSSSSGLTNAHTIGGSSNSIHNNNGGNSSNSTMTNDPRSGIGMVITPGTTQTVGTINGLRLGGRPWVDWNEINAAMGLVALCVDRIAAKVGCVFETYKIVPYGSYSRVDELPPSKNSYELWASSDITPARLLQNRRFNYALVGLLDCLRQLVDFGKIKRKGWAGGGLEIRKDKIGDYSIKLNFNMGMSSIGIGGGTSSTGSKEEENWTRALRAVLAVLKRILVVESETDKDAEG